MTLKLLNALERWGYFRKNVSSVSVTVISRAAAPTCPARLWAGSAGCTFAVGERGKTALRASALGSSEQGPNQTKP